MQSSGPAHSTPWLSKSSDNDKKPIWCRIQREDGRHSVAAQSGPEAAIIMKPIAALPIICLWILGGWLLHLSLATILF